MICFYTILSFLFDRLFVCNGMGWDGLRVCFVKTLQSFVFFVLDVWDCAYAAKMQIS